MTNRVPAIEREERAEKTEQTAPARPEPRRTEPEPPPPPRRARWRVSRRGLFFLGAVLTVVAIVAVLFSHLFDERLRRTLDAKINQNLTGYHVTLGHAHLNPLDLALTLRNLVIRQDANPDPPVADIPRLKASVEWPALLVFHLVADAVFDQPRVHINLPQIEQEAHDKIRLKDRGWQQAFESIYPLKFNHVVIREGQLAYIDTDADKPFLVSHWNLDAQDIRNIHTRPGKYPSPVHTEGIVFDTGRAVADGHADFLAEPYPGVHAVFSADRIPLDRLRPLVSRADLSLHGGVLSSRGEFELSPRFNQVRIDDLTARGMSLDYLHSTATVATEKRREAEVKAEVNRESTIPIEIRRVHLVGGELGLVDRAKTPPFRVFLDNLDLEVRDLVNGPLKNPVRAQVTGRLMGTGTARGNATFHPSTDGPSFDLAIAVEGAELPKVNDLLRAYGKFDVAAGTFSVYSQIAVKNGQVQGYVKPLFKDVQVYDSRQDKDKPPMKKLYEHVLNAAAHLLKNRPRQEVATQIDLSGPLGGTRTSPWKAISGLFSNAFVKAIVPGFDREIAALRQKR